MSWDKERRSDLVYAVADIDEEYFIYEMHDDGMSPADVRAHVDDMLSDDPDVIVKHLDELAIELDCADDDVMAALAEARAFRDEHAPLGPDYDTAKAIAEEMTLFGWRCDDLESVDDRPGFDAHMESCMYDVVDDPSKVLSLFAGRDDRLQRRERHIDVLRDAYTRLRSEERRIDTSSWPEDVHSAMLADEVASAMWDDSYPPPDAYYETFGDFSAMVRGCFEERFQENLDLIAFGDWLPDANVMTLSRAMRLRPDWPVDTTGWPTAARVPTCVRSLSPDEAEVAHIREVLADCDLEDRVSLAVSGWDHDLNALVYDPDPSVRLEVARHGRIKDMAVLEGDADPEVAAAVAEQVPSGVPDVLKRNVVRPDAAEVRHPTPDEMRRIEAWCEANMPEGGDISADGPEFE